MKGYFSYFPCTYCIYDDVLGKKFFENENYFSRPPPLVGFTLALVKTPTIGNQ